MNDARQTESEPFALLSRDFEQILGQIVSLRVKTLSSTNLLAPRHIKREKGSLPVDVRRSKTSPLKLKTPDVRTVNGAPIMVIAGVRLLFRLV